MSVISDMIALLNLFEEVVPDHDSNRLVYKFVTDKQRWIKAHGLFSTIRDRTLKAGKEQNELKLAQYRFEESCAKTLFNLTRSKAPFDPDAPYWIIKNALLFAKKADIPVEKVVDIVVSQSLGDQ